MQLAAGLVMSGTMGSPLNPFLNREEKVQGIGARVLFDATFPYHWPAEDTPAVIDFQHGWPEEIREKVLAKWEEYGLGPP